MSSGAAGDYGAYALRDRWIVSPIASPRAVSASNVAVTAAAAERPEVVGAARSVAAGVGVTSGVGVAVGIGEGETDGLGAAVAVGAGVAGAGVGAGVGGV